MNRFLPSKKLLVFLGIALVILGCFVLFFKYENRKTTYFLNSTNQEDVIKITNEISQQTLKNDSDGDGLKDWEEILWKTDPQNPDTDGDGTDDNTEVLAKRDPLIAGPDDLLGEDIMISTDTHGNSEYNKPLTQTDILSRELFTGYMALKQNNQLGTEQEEQFINNLVTTSLSLNANSSEKYTLSDLNIIQNGSKEALQQYSKQLKEISKLGDTQEHDLIIIKRFLEKKDQLELEELNSNKKTYKKMEEQLLNVPIPEDLSLTHLDITNTVHNLIDNIIDMSLILIDPIAGLEGVQNYINNETILINKVREIIVFYDKNDIKF